jgi:hypothetical protein
MTTKQIVQDKLWMKKAQEDAKKVMRADTKIWEKHGWKSGGDVKDPVLKKELKKIFGKRKFDPVVAEILEDANFHSSNQALEELGMVVYKGDRLQRYRKLGGKTWEL